MAKLRRSEKLLRIQVKNGSDAVVYKSVDEIINSEFELNTMEFCLHKTVETELEKQAFEVLKEKIENQKCKLLLEGVQIVLSLEVENQYNLKQEIKKCVENIDEIIEQIRIDTSIERKFRLQSCIIGNLINSELRVEMV